MGINKPTTNKAKTVAFKRNWNLAKIKDASADTNKVITSEAMETMKEFVKAVPIFVLCQTCERLPHCHFSGSEKGILKNSSLVLKALVTSQYSGYNVRMP